MYDDQEARWTSPVQAPPPRRNRRWWIPLGLALAFALAVGAGAILGSSLLRTAQAAGNPSNYSYMGQLNAQVPFASAHGARGQGGPGHCDALTVSSVNGQTIVAKASDGSSVTIHTTSTTTYSRNGQSATASAVTAGSRIHVDGTHNSDGSIAATHIDVLG